MFQEKRSGVFMKAINNVKIEKLLDPERPGEPERAGPAAPAPAPATSAAPAAPKASASGGRLRK